DVADAAQAEQFVLDLDGGVVGQVDVVVAAVGGDEVDDQEDAGRLLLGGDALDLHLLGQLGRGQGDAVLDEDLVDVGVGAQLEGDGEVVGAVVGALTRHVHHLVHAADLLLDRGGDAVGDDLGVGAGVDGGHADRRRRDVWVLGDGQHEDG